MHLDIRASLAKAPLNHGGLRLWKPQHESSDDGAPEPKHTEKPTPVDDFAKEGPWNWTERRCALQNEREEGNDGSTLIRWEQISQCTSVHCEHRSANQTSEPPADKEPREVRGDGSAEREHYICSS